MSRIFPAFSGGLVWLALGPAAIALEPPAPPADDDVAPAYSPLDQQSSAALLARRIRPGDNAGPPRPSGLTAQAGAPPQRLATSLPTTNRIPRVNDAPIPPAPIAEPVPGTVSAATPKQINTYETTGIPDPFAPGADSVDSPVAAPLEPLGRQTDRKSVV